MADKTDARRLVDLRAALAAVKPRALLSLADCAALWGVTKPRFVNKRAEFTKWPEPIVDGNRHDFPARAALRSMIAHIERHQQAATARTQRQAKMLGDGAHAEALSQFSPAELATMNKLAADIAQREIAQGLYIPRGDVERTGGFVFSAISEFCSQLSNMVDPHGKLEPAIHALIDSKSHEALLGFYSQMKWMLSDDATVPGARNPAAKPKPAPARRKRTKRVVKSAR